MFLYSSVSSSLVRVLRLHLQSLVYELFLRVKTFVLTHIYHLHHLRTDGGTHVTNTLSAVALLDMMMCVKSGGLKLCVCFWSSTSRWKTPELMYTMCQCQMWGGGPQGISWHVWVFWLWGPYTFCAKTYKSKILSRWGSNLCQFEGPWCGKVWEPLT